MKSLIDLEYEIDHEPDDKNIWQTGMAIDSW